MSVSPDYLAAMRRAVRRSEGNPEVDAELTELVEEARADLAAAGVAKQKAEDEDDPLIKGAVRCFVRWKFGLANGEAQPNAEDYTSLKDMLRKTGGYKEGEDAVQ
ncbi:hypothetical protein [Allofournierella sp.]|uniref:hypothetical protein n=1 Tax=Allofournierella sp. TaxID=1940256 RepID=UPI003AF0E322